ncbi:methylated-DNA-[protein]-cysteine S-methyltransferase [Oxalobacter formigenes HOxBLS]|uniref:Methylated-DNA-[protein]-cysteine S-methyltransferase n=2 Tax=Oxalobacter paraformigenes TaxID=556268 RepID=C3X531_9BURK|nr:methylated-DNA-[protein]-cysteine S-methyltransferase [Oxalobacter paraformigenes]
MRKKYNFSLKVFSEKMHMSALIPDRCSAIVRTSFGSVGIAVEHETITAIRIFPDLFVEKKATDALSAEAVRQIRGYLDHPGACLDLPVTMPGREIHRRVWRELMSIPCGEIRTYGELGNLLHLSPGVICRACEENPLSLYIPSHRVIAITGPRGPVGEGDPSSARLRMKRWLLKHEGFLYG